MTSEVIKSDPSSPVIEHHSEHLNNITAKTVIQKNILICGRSGTGKSTIANALIHQHYKGEHPFKIHAGYKSGTTTTTLQIHSFNAGNDLTYVLNIIDAVGFFDGKVSNSKTLADVRKILKEDLKMRLDRIVFVFAYGRYTIEESKSMSLLFDNLGESIKEISILCITNTEDFTTEKRNQELKKFQTEETTKNIADKMGEIIMTGIKSIDGLEEMFKRAYISRGDEDANKLRRHILSNSKKIKFDEKICSGLQTTIENA